MIIYVKSWTKDKDNLLDNKGLTQEMDSYSNRIFTVTIAQCNETINNKISLNSNTQQESINGKLRKDEDIMVTVETDERRDMYSNASNSPHSKDMATFPSHITLNLEMSSSSNSIPDEPLKTFLSG